MKYSKQTGKTTLGCHTCNTTKNGKLQEKKIKKYKKLFKLRSKVLYFIGDRQMARNKWRRRWSGPWIVDKHLNDSTLIIADPTNGNQNEYHSTESKHSMKET